VPRSAATLLAIVVALIAAAWIAHEAFNVPGCGNVRSADARQCAAEANLTDAARVQVDRGRPSQPKR